METGVILFEWRREGSIQCHIGLCRYVTDERWPGTQAIVKDWQHVNREWFQHFVDFHSDIYMLMKLADNYSFQALNSVRSPETGIDEFLSLKELLEGYRISPP